MTSTSPGRGSAPDPDGATPLDPDDAEDLLPDHLASRADLNAWEQANIAKAVDWVAHATYPTDEIAARFHHRLVQIHPFPNGNGRHGRLMADALLVELGASPFTWDAGDYALLLGFVRGEG
jgi:fido (protein-threonine AMPylation protein)